MHTKAGMHPTTHWYRYQFVYRVAKKKLDTLFFSGQIPTTVALQSPQAFVVYQILTTVPAPSGLMTASSDTYTHSIDR